MVIIQCFFSKKMQPLTMSGFCRLFSTICSSKPNKFLYDECLKAKEGSDATYVSELKQTRFERRVSTGSGLFSFLCGIFDQIFGQIIPIIISIGTVTNAKASATLVTVHVSTNLLIIFTFLHLLTY